MFLLLNKIKSLLCENNGALKLAFTISCLYLLTSFLYIYLIEKPTMTLVTKKKFNREDFPEITVCPDPSVNTEALNSYGYSNLWDYKNGFVKKMNLSKNQISWRGNNSKTTVKDIYNDISIIKTDEDCPNYLSALWYTSRNNKGFGIQSLNFTLAMVMYPDNRCCKAVIPNMTDVGLIKGVRFFFSSKNKPYDFVKGYLCCRHSFLLKPSRVVCGRRGVANQWHSGRRLLGIRLWFGRRQ